VVGHQASGVAVPYTLLAAFTGATFPPDMRTLSLNLLVGTLYTFSIGFLNTGIRKIGAVKASFISILEPVTSVLLSTILFHYQLGKEIIIGCCLTIGAILFITRE
jgi:drug/metabolite transporter (DMT)-like permease